MTYVVGEPCIDVRDRRCVSECPVDCIYLGERKAYINPDECIDCGACVLVCPVNAIGFDQELGETDMVFADQQVELFQGIGQPGGASAFGPISDHPAVAALPRKQA